MTEDFEAGGEVAPVEEPEAGTPTPSDDLMERIRRLEQENAKLREERRAERAERLGATHGLTPTEVELLRAVPADQMEAKAKALAEERAQLMASKAEPPEQAPAAGAPEVSAFDQEPAATAPQDVSLSWQDEMNRRISEAKSLEEIAQIQEEFRKRQIAGTG